MSCLLQGREHAHVLRRPRRPASGLWPHHPRCHCRNNPRHTMSQARINGQSKARLHLHCRAAQIHGPGQQPMSPTCVSKLLLFMPSFEPNSYGENIYYIIILLYYYITILLYCYITTLLHYYITILLYYYITILLLRCLVLRSLGKAWIICKDGAAVLVSLSGVYLCRSWLTTLL